MKPNRICLVPRVSGVGGMVSFRARFSAGLAARGFQISEDLDDRSCEAVLVIGGTRQLAGLWRARRRGIPIVQRLDGMNWLHRVRNGPKKPPFDLRHYLRAEYGNWLLALIRARLATGVVYQSRFSQEWWYRRYGAVAATGQVVYNAVDLGLFTPDGLAKRPSDICRILMVEGSLMGGYETGLEAAVRLAQELANLISEAGQFWNSVELMVAGRVSPEVQAIWNQRLAHGSAGGRVTLTWHGLVLQEHIPQLDRSAHLLYSADINPACPNSVIEALACGLPVLAFDTGALPELVTPQAGRVVAYGGDPWKLDAPDVVSLSKAALEIVQEQPALRSGARARAVECFGIDKMVDGYLNALSMAGRG